MAQTQFKRWLLAQCTKRSAGSTVRKRADSARSPGDTVRGKLVRTALSLWRDADLLADFVDLRRLLLLLLLLRARVPVVMFVVVVVVVVVADPLPTRRPGHQPCRRVKN